MTAAERELLREVLRDVDRAHDRITRRGAMTAVRREEAAVFTKAAGDTLSALITGRRP